MPPKVKVIKEEIINAAVEIVRKNGAQAINARTIAAALECSTQPIFSNFATMDELRLAVVENADKLCNKYIEQEIKSEKYPIYKASGMAYIRFAKEEKELFKLLYMRDRSNEKNSTTSEVDNKMTDIIKENIALDSETASLFHLEMWAYVHGIAVMVATDYINLEWELISRMITDAYQGLCKQYGMGE